MAEAPIGNDGTYSVKTLVGGNMVTAETPETARNPSLVPPPSEFIVKSGDNTYDIELGTPEMP